ncbi:MAG: glycosyl transferase [Candidatus Parabeggiatoa sp. nov. 1]|nr:MAG: glycosyl transferase [Gammaproteobacteria bacterium]
MYNNKIYYHIGSYPPPLGGVSVHIYRHSKLLQKEGWIVKNIDYSKGRYFGKLLKILTLILVPNMNVIHMHGSDFKSIFALILRPYKSTIKLTDHSGRKISELKGLKKCLFIIFLKKIDQLILVGKHLETYYESNGIKIPNNKAVVENAFIPPPKEDEPIILQTYTEQTKNFIKAHQPLIIANAFQLVFYQGTDLYGLDMCIELTAKLKEKYPNMGFLFALANDKENQSYLNKMKNRIKELDIEENFLFMTGQKELWPLFKKANLMVRPTNTDGDALSIREALYFSCPAIASDVCKRSEGTVLFKTRDMDDLFEKVQKILL